MSLAAQIIDQRVSGIVEEQSDNFDNELRLGTDEDRRRSIAFLFLVAKAIFDLTDDQTMDGIVDGGNDFGIDALYLEPPADGELHITLIQGKYRRGLGGDSAFPENDIARMIDAIGPERSQESAPWYGADSWSAPVGREAEAAARPCGR